MLPYRVFLDNRVRWLTRTADRATYLEHPIAVDFTTMQSTFKVLCNDVNFRPSPIEKLFIQAKVKKKDLATTGCSLNIVFFSNILIYIVDYDIHTDLYAVPVFPRRTDRWQFGAIS